MLVICKFNSLFQLSLFKIEDEEKEEEVCSDGNGYTGRVDD
jgi:hypothetical protein